MALPKKTTPLATTATSDASSSAPGRCSTRCSKRVNDAGLEKEIALVRVEQLAPFPHGALASRLGKYPDAEIVWCQEEPKNMGWWPFVQPRINTAVRDLLSRDGDGDGGGGRRRRRKPRRRRRADGAVRRAAVHGVARDG